MSSKKLTMPFRWLLLLIPIALIVIFLATRSAPSSKNEISSKSTTTSPEIKTEKRKDLADLALPPDWSQLERFQKTISRQTFLQRLQTIYTKDDSWKKWIVIDEEENTASIGDFILHFSKVDSSPPGAIFDWRTRSDLSPSREHPLEGLHIALDPGHIGGDFAEIEDREYIWEDNIVREGTMTLRTAQILTPLLEERGAKVSLVRSELKPVTDKRASDFSNPRLFYRTSEIRARAALINHNIQPDVVICLHYNGTGSKSPESSQNFHIILNGTYTAGELAHQDERFQMLQRLLSGTITEEIPLARMIADAFNERIKLPPYRYSDTSRTSQRIGNHPNLWGRNLLANRLYQCPVIFMEPYIMNSHPFMARLKEDPEEIYLEYAQAVARGITAYYQKN